MEGNIQGKVEEKGKLDASLLIRGSRNMDFSHRNLLYMLESFFSLVQLKNFNCSVCAYNSLILLFPHFLILLKLL